MNKVLDLLRGVRRFMWQETTLYHWQLAILVTGALLAVIHLIVESPIIMGLLIALYTIPDLAFWLYYRRRNKTTAADEQGSDQADWKTRLGQVWNARRRYYNWQLVLHIFLIGFILAN